MERNANDTFGEQGLGGIGNGTPSATGGAAGSAGERLTDASASALEKAGNLKNSIADALQSGAERLRQQGGSGGQLAGATGTGAGMDLVSEESRLAQTSNQLAGGMQGAADWLRDAELEGLKTGLERQVKEHPGRTLAIAVGVGYLLGKAFRR